MSCGIVGKCFLKMEEIRIMFAVMLIAFLVFRFVLAARRERAEAQKIQLRCLCIWRKV